MKSRNEKGRLNPPSKRTWNSGENELGEWCVWLKGNKSRPIAIVYDFNPLDGQSDNAEQFPAEANADLMSAAPQLLRFVMKFLEKEKCSKRCKLMRKNDEWDHDCLRCNAEVLLDLRCNWLSQTKKGAPWIKDDPWNED